MVDPLTLDESSQFLLPTRTPPHPSGGPIISEFVAVDAGAEAVDTDILEASHKKPGTKLSLGGTTLESKMTHHRHSTSSLPYELLY